MNTLNRIKRSVANRSDDVLLRGEFDQFGSAAQVGRALRELIPAGLFAIIATILVGFIGGVSAVGGFLLGNIVSGLLLSLFMSNAGGAWDNAKKYIERGNHGGGQQNRSWRIQYRPR